MLGVERRVSIRAQGGPIGARLRQFAGVQVSRAGSDIGVGGGVRRDQRGTRAGLDGHVAQGHAGFGRQAFDGAAAEFHGMAARALRADAVDHVDHQVLGRHARGQAAVDADAHVARDPVDQRLRRQDVLDFRGADAETQRPQRAVGGGVAVAAQHHHARQDHAVLGRDHVFDALQRIGGVEQRDVLLVAIALEIAGLAR